MVYLSEGFWWGMGFFLSFLVIVLVVLIILAILGGLGRFFMRIAALQPRSELFNRKPTSQSSPGK